MQIKGKKNEKKGKNAAGKGGMDGDWIAAETTKKGNSALSRGAGNELISSSRIQSLETDEGRM